MISMKAKIRNQTIILEYFQILILDIQFIMSKNISANPRVTGSAA